MLPPLSHGGRIMTTPVPGASPLSQRGFFGVGIEHTKTNQNIGTLWRSAHILGASFIFTIGHRYKKQASDTTKAWRTIPLYTYDTFDDFYESLPYDCQLVGIEIDQRADSIKNFAHPERCVYLLGAEDHGLTKKAIEKCHKIVVLPGDYCMNVSVSGSIVMSDRWNKAA
jgi:tRNA G18 (ribose-2'-O)-methylase SpoU